MFMFLAVCTTSINLHKENEDYVLLACVWLSYEITVRALEAQGNGMRVMKDRTLSGSCNG